MWCNLIIWFDLHKTLLFPPLIQFIFTSIYMIWFHMGKRQKDDQCEERENTQTKKIHTSAAILSDPKPTTDLEGPTRLLVDYDKTHPAHGTMVDGA